MSKIKTKTKNSLKKKSAKEVFMKEKIAVTGISKKVVAKKTTTNDLRKAMPLEIKKSESQETGRKGIQNKHEIEAEIAAILGGKQEISLKKTALEASSDIAAASNLEEKEKLAIDFPSEGKITKIPRAIFVVTSVIFFVILSVFFCDYYFNRKASLDQQIDSENLQAIKDRIGVFMELPKDEDPTLILVKDIEKKQAQYFSAKAQNGDSVLVYPKNKKAILYRWSINKVLDFADINIFAQQSPENSSDQTVAQEIAPAEAPTQTSEIASQQNEIKIPENQTLIVDNKVEVKVTVLNGSRQKGLAKKRAEEISKIASVSIFKTGNTKGNFQKTLIVDLNGKNETVASEIAKVLGGEISELPESETSQGGDILVIVGN